MDELLIAHFALTESEFLAEVAANTAALAVDTETQKIVHATSEAEKLFQCKIKNGLRGFLFEDFIPPAARDIHRFHVAEYLKNPHPRPVGDALMKIEARSLDDVVFPVAIGLHPIKKMDRLYVILTIMRLPEEKQ